MAKRSKIGPVNIDLYEKAWGHLAKPQKIKKQSRSKKKSRRRRKANR
jgi:hypothetical protein